VKHTVVQYSAVQTAFDEFNGRLFDGDLPQCLVTLQRIKKAKGYFWHDQFRARTGAGSTDEIALNPDTFEGRSDREILSTLAHEMCHLWQAHFGKPGRRGYHNAEWAEKMISIGLQPTDTGEVGGKTTGEKITHLIVEGGRFAVVADRLLSRGVLLNWNATPETGAAKAKKQTRAKFTCPSCGVAAWAKPGARLACADCSEDDSELVLMEEELPA
jgi:Zn finger protein HypA/HybF involved in hydrogenase expression